MCVYFVPQTEKSLDGRKEGVNRMLEELNVGSATFVCSQKVKASITTFRLHTKVTVPLLNSLSLANHDMRKTWYSVAGVYGTMTRSC